MDYKLAKKLADAHFPSYLIEGEKIIRIDFQIKDSTVFPQEYLPIAYLYIKDSLGNLCSKTVYSPTLSELIEACGKDFTLLEKTEIGFFCPQTTYKKGHNCYVISGCPPFNTPEEAVANLYLKLNKK